MIRYFPNILTTSRIFLTAAFAYCFLQEQFIEALILFSLSATSDFFDGYLARRLQITSRFGAILDPIADKLAMFVSYSIFFIAGIIPGWLLYVVIGRDVLIVSTVLLCFLNKVAIEFRPIYSSKINTTIQFIFVVIVLILKAFSVSISLSPFMLIVCFSTIYSGAEYAQKYKWIIPQLFKR